MTSTPPKARGFAAMDPQRQRALARLGGQSVPADKRSFSTNSTLAKSAGSKGGNAPRKGRAR